MRRDLIGLPSQVILPLVGSSIRLTIRSVVVLPQPDGPTITVIWPDGTTRLRLSTAVVPSRKVLETDSNSITRNPCYLVLVGLDAPAGRDHDWPVARAANQFDPRRRARRHVGRRIGVPSTSRRRVLVTREPTSLEDAVDVMLS